MNRKIIKSIQLFLVSSLLIFISFLTINSNKSKEVNAYDFPASEADYKIEYYSDYQLQNPVTTVNPGDTVYMAIQFYNSGNIVYKNFEFGWNGQTAVTAGVEFKSLYTGTQATDRTAIANALSVTPQVANTLWLNTYKPIGYAGKAGPTLTVNAPNSSNVKLGISMSNADDVNLFDDWAMIGLFQVKVPSTVSSITLTKINCKIGDYTYSTTAAFKDIGFPMAAASDSVEVATATVSSANKTATNLTASGKDYSGTIPSQDSTASVVFTIKDAGVIQSVSDGTSTTYPASSPISVTLANPGDSKKLTINVKSKSGSKSETYTVTITRDKRSTKTLDGITFANPSGTATTIVAPSMTPAFNSATLTGYTVNFANVVSAIEVTPTITPSVGIKKVTVNGNTYTSPTPVSVPVSSTADTTVNVLVTAEDDSTQPYQFTLHPLLSDVKLGTVTLYGNGTTNEGNLTVDNTAHTVKGSLSTTYPSFTIAAFPNKTGNTVEINGVDVTSKSSKMSDPISFSGTQITATIKITDKDTGESQTYTVTIDPKKRDTKTLASITFTNPSGTPSTVMAPVLTPTFSSSVTTGYTVKYDGSLSQLNVAPVVTSGAGIKGFKVNGAAVTGSSVNVPVAGNTVTVTVIAEDDSEQDYTFTLSPLTTNTNITSVALLGGGLTTLTAPSVDNTNHTITGTIPYAYTDFTLKITPSKSGNKVFVNGVDTGTSLTSGITPVVDPDTTMTVKIVDFETGAEQDYAVTITKAAPSSAKDVTAVTLQYGSTMYTVTKSGDTFTNVGDKLPYNATTAIITATITGVKYDVTASGVAGTPNYGSGVAVTYTLESTLDLSKDTFVADITAYDEGGNPKVYTFTIVRDHADVDSTLDLTSVSFSDEDGNTYTPTYDATNKEWKIELPYKADNLKVNVRPNSTKATLTIDGTSAPAGYDRVITVGTSSTKTAIPESTHPIVVKAEDTTTTTYNVKVSRKAAETDNTASSIVVDNVTKATNDIATVQGDGVTYDFGELSYDTNEILVKVTAAGQLSTVKINGTDQTSSTRTFTFTKTLPNDGSAQTISIPVVITAEDGTPKTYTISGTRKAAAGSVTASFEVYGNYTTTAITPTVVGNTYTYVFGKNDSVATLKINPTPVADTKAVYYQADALTATGKIPYTTYGSMIYPTIGDYATGKTYYVQVVPEKGEGFATLYTLVFKAADTRSGDKSLQNLYVEDTLGNVLPFDAPDTTYNPSTLTYNITVPYSSGNLTIYANPTDSNAKVYRNSSKADIITNVNVSALTPGTPQAYHFMVQAEDTTWGSDYVINVYRKAGNAVGEVDDILVNSTSVDGFVKSADGTYDVCLPRTTTVVDLKVKVGTQTFAPSVAGTTVDGVKVTATKSGTNPIVYVINAIPEDPSGVTHTYQVNVYKASQVHAVTSFDILKAGTNSQQVDKTGNIYIYPAADFYLPFVVNQVTLDLKTDSYANVSGSLVGTGNVNALISLNNYGTTPNVVTFVIKSEYAMLNSNITDQKTTVTVNIYRDAPDDTNTIKSFTSSDGTYGPAAGVDGTVPGPLTVTSIPSSVGTISVTVTATSAKSKVQIDTHGEGQDISKATLGGETESVDVSSASTVDNYIVYVWGEDQTKAPKTYALKITHADTVTLDGDHTISNIKFYGNTATAQNNKTADSTNKVSLDSDEISGQMVVTYSSKATLKVTIGTNTTDYTGGSASIVVPVASGASESVTIQCIAEDTTKYSTPETYTFERAAQSTNSTATAIQVNGNPVSNLTANNTSTNVNTVVLAPNTTTATVSVTLPPKATVDVTSVSGLQPGNNQRPVTVTAEDGVTKSVYTLNIYVMPESKATDITVVGETMTPAFAAATPNYDVHVTHDKNSVKIIVTLPDASLYKAYIGTDGIAGTTKEITLDSATRGSANKETIPVKIVTLNPDGTESTDPAYQTTYNIIVERDQASSDNFLLDIKINGLDVDGFNKNTNTYYVSVPRTTGSVSFTNATDGTTALNVSPNATYTVDSNLALTPGQINTKTITVKSQSGVDNVYKFNIVPAETTVGFSDIQLLTSASGSALKDVDSNNAIVTYVAGDTGASGSVAYSTENAYLKITATNQMQKVKVNGLAVTLSGYDYGTLETLSVGANTFKVEAMSEYASLVEGTSAIVPANQKLAPYVITVTRNTAKSNPNLDILEVQVGGVAIPFDLTSQNVTATGVFISDSGSSNLNIQNLTTATQIYIKAEPVESTTVLSGDYNVTKTLQSLSSATEGYNFNFTITATAEDGSKATYNIVITRGPLNLNDDNKITGITLFDSNSQTYVSPNNTGYTVEQWTEAKLNYPSAMTAIEVPYGAQSISFQVDKLGVSPASLVIVPSNASQQSNTSGAFSFTIDNTFYGKTITYIIYAISESGKKGTEYKFTLSFAAPSADSSITALTVDGTTVDGFDASVLITTGTNGTKTYQMINVVPFSKNSITVFAVANDPNASIASGLGTYALDEGPNSFPVTVFAQDGSQSTYIIKINRDYQTPYITDMTLSDGKFVLADGVSKTTFDSANAGNDSQIVNYTVKIPFTATSLTITTTVDNSGYTVTESKSIKSVVTAGQTDQFKTPTISAGTSISLSFVVTSPESKTKTYTITVKRATEAESDSSVGTIKIKELTDFEDQYDENTFTYDTQTYKFTVEHKVDALTVEAIPTAAQDGASTKIYGDKNLTTGPNTVVIQTTSADKLTTTTYVVEVTRKPMEWDVNTAATSFETKADTAKVAYTVNMGKSKATDVTDWTKYITYDTTDKTITVKNLTPVKDDTNQVILEVTDGITTEHVTLNLQFEQGFLQQMSSNWWIWVILAADVVLLTAILISVNRDKYGKVTKKRKEI